MRGSAWLGKGAEGPCPHGLVRECAGRFPCDLSYQFSAKNTFMDYCGVRWLAAWGLLRSRSLRTWSCVRRREELRRKSPTPKHFDLIGSGIRHVPKRIVLLCFFPSGVTGRLVIFSTWRPQWRDRVWASLGYIGTCQKGTNTNEYNENAWQYKWSRDRWEVGGLWNTSS